MALDLESGEQREVPVSSLKHAYLHEPQLIARVAELEQQLEDQRSVLAAEKEARRDAVDRLEASEKERLRHLELRRQTERQCEKMRCRWLQTDAAWARAVGQDRPSVSELPELRFEGLFLGMEIFSRAPQPMAPDVYERWLTKFTERLLR